MTPFLGVPNAWKKWMFVALGTLIAIVAYRLRRARYLRSLETGAGERRAEAFVENKTPLVTSLSREA